MPHSTVLTAMIRACLLCDPEICNHKPALELRESLMPALLILANGTGRRISAICSHRFADLRLGVGPHGSIRWPADTDETGVESVAPITTNVREVLDPIEREQPGMGAAPLFPSPRNPSQPIRYELASGGLIEAEKLAGLPLRDPLNRCWQNGWVTRALPLPGLARRARRGLDRVGGGRVDPRADRGEPKRRGVRGTAGIAVSDGYGSALRQFSHDAISEALSAASAR